MYARPSVTDTEDDILRLQEEFLRKKESNEVVPAAKLVKDTVTQLDNRTPQQIAATNVQERLENTFESVPTNFNIGRIVEKTVQDNKTPLNFGHKKGFPQAKRRDTTITPARGSIFSQQMKRLKTSSTSAGCSFTKSLVIKENKCKETDHAQGTVGNIPSHSCILTGQEKDEIHKENLGILQQMGEAEIIEERERLLATMDPAIVTFLQSKKKEGNESRTTSIAQQNKAAENINIEKIEASKDVIAHPEADKWLNFDTVESGKLTWMTDIEIPRYKKDQVYEARFDFAGWVLPYAEPDINEKNRSLYHHGEEPGRPGYTLQELFQLCRSSVNQQKIVALNTIAQILSLQQSGVYDNIIEIPAEQIFFVLRFCLDDNTPAVLNASIKAIRNLFFYPIDETCLDNLLGFGLGMVQPVIAVDNTEVEDDNTVNDQQLAEANLIKCLARTDILKRIRYVINTIQPSLETIVYCIEILIRMARDSDYIVKQICACENLLGNIAKFFVPASSRLNSLESPYGCPLQQAVKLFRVLCARKKDIALAILKRYNLMESITAYLSDELLSVNSNGLKLQIESMHLWCIFLRYGVALDDFIKLEPILQRLLHFHARNTNADGTTSYVIQSHVAAFLILLAEAASNPDLRSAVVGFAPLLSEVAAIKWTAQCGAMDRFTCGKLQVISALLVCATRFGACNFFKMELLENTVRDLLASDGFNAITDNVRCGSNLLSSCEAHRPSANLKSLEAAAWKEDDHIVPTLHTSSCLPFLAVLSNFISSSNSYQIKLNFLNHKNVKKYLRELNKAKNYHLINNWFTRLESQFIINVLKIAVVAQKDLDTSLFYEIAVKCLSIFSWEQKPEMAFLLTNVVFSPSFYPCEALMHNLEISEGNSLLKQALGNLDNIFSVYVDVLNIKVEETSYLSVELAKGSVMPIDWIYSPIILLYTNQQQNNLRVSEEKQAFIVTNCLRWIYIYEMYFPALAKLINPTDRFCRIACTFLGSDTLFLIPEVHDLLEACLKHIIASNEKNINFKKPIQGLNNFQDFYTQLLEQYQGVSYGDVLFGNFILLPLIQRHDVKYRKLLWSEYAGVVQIFNVTPEQVLCPVELFLHPSETDVSLVKCYRRVLVTGAVRKHSILYKIATHHVEALVAKMKAEKKNVT